MKNMKKAADCVFVALFAVFLLGIFLLTTQRRDRTYSHNENRNLAERPELTAEALWDGSYFDQWDKFWLDRAVGRSTALKLDTYWQWKVLKRPVVHNIVITDEVLLPYWKDEYFEPPRPIDERVEEVANELAALDQHIQDNGGRFYYVGMPSQTTYFKESYPDFLYNRDEILTQIRLSMRQALADRDVDFLDMVEAFNQAGNPEEFYWKTDHHANLDGGLFVYHHIMDRINEDTGLGLRVLEEEDLVRVTLEEPFSGSRNRQLYYVVPTDDKLTYAELKEPIPFERYNRGEKSWPIINVLPDEGQMASYSVFMGGDMPETSIKTNRPELPKLLIFGDSYSNVLETLLYPSFDEMRTLDLRYYNDKTLWEYIEEYQPDIVIDVRDDSEFLSDSANNRFR